MGMCGHGWTLASGPQQSDGQLQCTVQTTGEILQDLTLINLKCIEMVVQTKVISPLRWSTNLHLVFLLMQFYTPPDVYKGSHHHMLSHPATFLLFSCCSTQYLWLAMPYLILHRGICVYVYPTDHCFMWLTLLHLMLSYVIRPVVLWCPEVSSYVAPVVGRMKLGFMPLLCCHCNGLSP